MARALALAEAATAVARPNPGVGCVLLSPNGDVIGTGATNPIGGPHAEVVALQEAGPDARGATAVVTLEPCNHTGRTGPCSVALIEAGVSRVVVATGDPDGDARGGVAALRAAGVDVEVGTLGEWAQEIHRSFLLSTRGRPALTLKVAMTAGGAMVVPGRRWVTGPEARRRVHELRSVADAVLVGIGTVLADDPRLDVRDVEVRADQPIPVVVDTHARTPPTATVVERGGWVLVGLDAPDERVEQLREAGATVIGIPPLDGRLDLEAAIVGLAQRGLRHVFAEPGPALGQGLLAAGLVDDVILHVAADAADVARTGGVPTVAPALARPLDHDVRRLRILGDDLEVHLRPTH